MKAHFKKIAAFLACITLGVFVILQLAGIVAWHKATISDHDPSVFGFTKTTVMSGSMEPTIHVGEMILTMKQDTYEIGDVIMVWDPDFELYILHRIIDVADGEFITKGDHNAFADVRLRDPDLIVGKCIYHSMFLGRISSFISNPVIALVLIGLVLFIPNKKE